MSSYFPVYESEIQLLDASLNVVKTAWRIDRLLAYAVTTSSGFILDTDVNNYTNFSQFTPSDINSAVYVKLCACIYDTTAAETPNERNYISGTAGTYQVGVSFTANDYSGTVKKETANYPTLQNVNADVAFGTRTLPSGATAPADSLTIETDPIPIQTATPNATSMEHNRIRLETAASNISTSRALRNTRLYRIEKNTNDSMISLVRYVFRKTTYQVKNVLGKGQGFWFPLN